MWSNYIWTCGRCGAKFDIKDLRPSYVMLTTEEYMFEENCLCPDCTEGVLRYLKNMEDLE